MSGRDVKLGIDKRWVRWTIGIVAALAVIAVVGPLLLAVFSRAPEDFISGRVLNEETITADDLEGSWDVAPGSQVGYRVGERIGLAQLDAVGRSETVTGSFTVGDGVLQRAEFVVDMDTFSSDRSQRDDEFRGRIMDVENHPEARFSLTEPVTIPTSTDVATMAPFEAVGDLTLRGTTTPTAFQIFAATDEGRLRLTGATEIKFSEWGIPNPSLPAAMIYTDSTGTLEFDLILVPAP
jgi:polyisoprenoid-binding protein YceI